MTQKRPFGVTILAILAGLAALIAIVHTLQMLNLLPLTGPFGLFKFYNFNALGAVAWGILALIYLWVLVKLWNLDVQGWLFLTVLSVLNLVLAFITFLGDTPWEALAPTIVLNGLILIYCLLPGTKKAFHVDEMQKMAHDEAVTSAAPDIAPRKDAPITAPRDAAPAAADVAETAAEAAPVAATAAAKIAEAAHASPGEAAKLGAHADFIEGIGPVYAGKLQEIGIETPAAMLEKGASRPGRDKIAAQTGISHKLILRWVHEADFYRVKGIGTQYAGLLDAAGVATVLELSQRNPEHLHEAVTQVNAEKHLVRELPSLNMISGWIEQAQELPQVVTY